MSKYLLVLVILIPILGGALIPILPFKKRNHRLTYMELLVILNTILVWFLLFHRPEEVLTILKFTGNLSVTFHMDGLGMVFAGLISALWPLATLYSCEYMKHEKHENIFFMFYTMTYGVTLGISLSANILSMYFFYELLTLVTTPLVIHAFTREAILATRKYLYYSLGGAAFAFIGMIFIIVYGISPDFTYGGVLSAENYTGNPNVLLLIYVLAFLGFGVKAAICPFNDWLPQAGVAPTPVTALLHAVAVVKSGAFAILRLTYYCFKVEFLQGTWAQKVVMSIVIFTIVYGCSMAVRERHMKRRLAYSTISNLSYILFGAVIMSPAGLVGALMHMVSHAVMKICSFFCVGAVMYKTGRNYVYEIDGFGKKMPKIFTIFTISTLALMGVPGLSGFISKFYLAQAAVESRNLMAYVGIGALLISAILTAIYLLSMVIRAFFPVHDFDYDTISDVEDPNWIMILPLTIFCIGMIFIGLYSKPLHELFLQIANGLL